MWYKVEKTYVKKWKRLVFSGFLIWIVIKVKKVRMFWSWLFFGRSENNGREGNVGYQTHPLYKLKH
jgi:hypothetical protein